MKPLKQPLPPNRTLQQVWNHYQTEAALAQRLKSADRAGRQRILATMYDELFSAVPDHPRLTRRTDSADTARANASKRAVLRRWLRRDAVVLEFAPGDGEFAASIAPAVRKVIGVDISDQRAPGRSWPDNFELVLYDGFSLPQLEPGSVDVIFSDQLLEHLHPEDTAGHLQLCCGLLKPGGSYVIRTPHPVSGPWDVSRYFCDDPEGFHLKEWTYHELREALVRAGFQRFGAAWNARLTSVPLPYGYFVAVESLFAKLPRRLAQRSVRPFVPTVLCIATK